MEVQVRHTQGAEFLATTRGHELVCDQPRENGGGDAGMTPPELMLASLGTCAGYYALQYLKARKLPNDGLRVRVLAEKASAPARLGKFRIELTAPAIGTRHEEGLLRAMRSCLIHNTLHGTPEVETVVRMGNECAIEDTIEA
jgi:uncharacterized OsmC-like protein